MEDRDVVVISAVRTPIGKYNGILRSVRPDDLAALIIQELVRRTSIAPSLIDDVYFGCSNQAGEDNRNVARMASLLSGLPYTVPAATVNRLCGSGLEAVVCAYRAIKTGEANLCIAGGVESMTRAPYVMLKNEEPFKRGSITLADTTIGWRFTNPKLAEKYPPLSMGETAENLAEKYSISREAQDIFAYESHMKAVRAIDEGKFKEEIVKVKTKENPEGVDTDEGPRRDTSIEKLSKLKPVFKREGTVTAGNSSGINDGSAGLIVSSFEFAEKSGLKPIARILGSAVAGVDPSYMGLGPVPATKKLLDRIKLDIEDFGVVELNEAFAAQVLACMEEMPELKEVNLNPNGGAIALGHPIGCSGARIAVTLLYEMKRKNYRYGLATMCIGVGQGISVAFELL